MKTPGAAGINVPLEKNPYGGNVVYQRLGDAQLKTGETVEIGLITPVDPTWTERLRKLLGHKGWEWVWQIGLSLDGKTDSLENRFYAARRGDDLLSTVCTFEKDGVGLLAHVWTPVEERRKGLASAVLAKVLEDFRSRSGRLMLLHTDYDTPSYHIYRKFGFEGYYEGSGCMRYSTQPDFERNYFAPGESKVVEATWAAWPKLNVLVAECEEFTKSIAYGKFFKADVEDAYIYLMSERARDARVSAKLLESSSTAAVVGYAWVVPDKRFPDVFLLDLYCQANHVANYERLLAAMTWPAVKVQCCVEAGLRKKALALEAAGFSLEATFKRQLKKRDGVADVWVYSRSAHP